MRSALKTVALAGLLLTAAVPGGAQGSFSISIGEPPAPRRYRVPPQPAPDYIWIEGYQYPERGRYRWHDGYWTRPPYQGAYWVQPYYDRNQYYPGRWEGDRGVLAHDHRWDRGRQRDENRRSDDNRADDRRPR